MAEHKPGYLDRLLHQSSVSRWLKATHRANKTESETLRKLRSQARQLRSVLDGFLVIAERRLALPKEGNQSFPKPASSDWAWRPPLWRDRLSHPGVSTVQSGTSLGEQVKVYHDCPLSEITLRQLRNKAPSDLAAFALRMDVFKFDGSYLSFAVDVPETAIQGLKKTHIVQMQAAIEMEQPLEIFARLNIKHGPNTEQLVQELPLLAEDIKVEFDLAYTGINEKSVSKMWVDLIFERPEMNQVTIRDLTFSRRLRAKL